MGGKSDIDAKVPEAVVGLLELFSESRRRACPPTPYLSMSSMPALLIRPDFRQLETLIFLRILSLNGVKVLAYLKHIKFWLLKSIVVTQRLRDPELQLASPALAHEGTAALHFLSLSCHLHTREYIRVVGRYRVLRTCR
jgi:hypothetical protein